MTNCSKRFMMLFREILFSDLACKSSLALEFKYLTNKVIQSNAFLNSKCETRFSNGFCRWISKIVKHSAHWKLWFNSSTRPTFNQLEQALQIVKVKTVPVHQINPLFWRDSSVQKTYLAWDSIRGNISMRLSLEENELEPSVGEFP